MTFRSIVVVLALVVLAWTAGSAESIFIRNKPFKGPTNNSGKNTLVGLKEFAEAMGLTVSERDGAWVVGNAPREQPEAGQVYIMGKKLSGPTDTGGVLMVPLWEAAEAAGAKAMVNKDLGTIDVNIVSNNRTASDGGKAGPGKTGPARPENTSGPVPPKTINTPGQTVSIESNLVPGKTNLVVFGASW